MSEPTGDFRPLTQAERELVDCLLRVDFPGRDELQEQVRHALVREFDEHGCLEFDVNTNVVAEVRHTIPVEAEAPDSDGIPIQVLLFVKRGKVSDLEFDKGDSSPILELPTSDRWEVRTN